MFEKISSVRNSSEASSGTSGLSGFFAGTSLFFFSGLSAIRFADLTVISGEIEEVFEMGWAGTSFVAICNVLLWIASELRVIFVLNLCVGMILVALSILLSYAGCSMNSYTILPSTESSFSLMAVSIVVSTAASF